jgi:hypothetical protein
MTLDTDADPMSHRSLKTKQRQTRENFPENLGLRVHRALSWLERAEKETEDQDAAFIFYWIAFNAAYARDDLERYPTGERSAFDDYFEKIISLDSNDQIYEAIWDRFSSFIRILLDNKYVYQPFWSHHNQMSGSGDWNERFEKSKKRTQAALGRKDTKLILTTLFDRLYVLRNQLVHGGATWNSKVNRSQVEDGTKVLAFLVPRFIDLMMENKDIEWGAPHYPVVE